MENILQNEGMTQALQGSANSNTQDLGTTIWDNWFSPIKDADQNIIGALSISTDVTDRAAESTAVFSPVLSARSACALGARGFAGSRYEGHMTCRTLLIFVDVARSHFYRRGRRA